MAAAADNAELVAEAQRQFAICSACRYCEGYCATFPAIERRTSFDAADVAYLANLCHDCRACAQACMFAPPHAFGVDIPRLLTRVRLETYRERAIPAAARAAFGNASAGFTLLAAAIALGVLLAAIAGQGRWALLSTIVVGRGAFYEVVPYLWMLVPALALAAWALFVLFAGARGLVRDAAPGARPALGDWWGALADGLGLAYMKGGGAGCYAVEAAAPSGARRLLHIVLVAGVLLAFAATVVAGVAQDLLGQLPPYPLLSAPVMLGLLGGAAILVGSIGLLALKAPRSADERAMTRMDVTFLVLLAIVSATGLLLLGLRTTPAMGVLLVVHLAAVAAVFVTAPYGKFMHVPLRIAALLVNRLEEARERGL